MFKQGIVMLYCFLCLDARRQLFKTPNRFSLLRGVNDWEQLTYDFDGIRYTHDTALRLNPAYIYFEDDVTEKLNDKRIFYKQYNNVPYGFDVDLETERIFYTVPRNREGIPSTLNYYNRNTYRNVTSGLYEHYDLKPYPDVDSIPSLVSVYRPRVDECRRLWVVDTGFLDVPDHHQQLKPPEVIVFDLLTDIEILRYQLKPSDLFNGTSSGLTSITVDVTSETCDDAYAYIPDSANGGLIVFSWRERDSWRFTHPTFTIDTRDYLKYNGRTIDWNDGICSIALSDPDAAGVRTAFYHPFQSTQEFSITTDVLKDKNGDIERSFESVGSRGPSSQSVIHVYHSATRNLLFANIARQGLVCWNVDKPLRLKNTALIAFDSWWLEFITDMKVYGDYLWLMSNSLMSHKFSNLYTDDTNFLIFTVNIRDLIKDTVCDGNKIDEDIHAYAPKEYNRYHSVKQPR